MTVSRKNAFPTADGDALHLDYHGLTKREYFAAMAMQGICGGLTSRFEYTELESLVKAAVLLSDALIAELNKAKDEK